MVGFGPTGKLVTAGRKFAVASEGQIGREQPSRSMRPPATTDAGICLPSTHLQKES